ncbi:MAG: PEP-CTERM sorting domain-containing protein, partial [Thermoguttaceae bacterium]
SDRYAGGTIVIDGTLVAASAYALPNGTSSTVGGTFIFDPAMAGAPMALVAAASQINPVPEPGTLVLLSVAVCGVAIYQRVCLRRKKR